MILSNPQERYQPAQPDAGERRRWQEPPVPHYGPAEHGQADYGQAEYGMPDEQPRRPKTLWPGLGILGGVLLLAIVGVVLFNFMGGASSKANDLADDFTQLVIAGDTDKAYDDFLDPALQEKLSKEEFAAGVQSLELNDTCKPTYNDSEVRSENGSNTADVAGVIGCDGKEVDLAYSFDSDRDMKMINIKLRPKA